MKFILFLLSFFSLLSCTKESRLENSLHGNWTLSRMQVTDGQLQQTIIDDPIGEVYFNFENAYVSGGCIFSLPINGGMYQFEIDFSSPNLSLDAIGRTLLFGQDEYLNTYKIILVTKRDLVLEYYDALNFQLRKFIFVKQE